MNEYLKSMKQALQTYWNTAKKHADEVKKANDVFQPDAAAAQIRLLEEKRKADRLTAESAITAALADAINSVDAWAALHGKDIDDDAKLLNFDMSDEQFLTLVERHRSNGTMCELLYQYAKKHGLDYTAIPSRQGKIEAYRAFANSALSLVGSITGGGFGQGVDSPMLKTAIENFGEPNAINTQLLQTIGS